MQSLAMRDCQPAKKLSHGHRPCGGPYQDGDSQTRISWTFFVPSVKSVL